MNDFSNDRKLYVGGLDFSVTERALQDMFAEFGTVDSVRLITDRMTGRSRGFGFVEMNSQSEAEAAMKALDGTDLKGRTLKVAKARPQQRRPMGSNNRRPSFSGRRRF